MQAFSLAEETPKEGITGVLTRTATIMLLAAVSCRHRVEAVYPKGPRFPSDRASLKVLTYEGSFPPP